MNGNHDDRDMSADTRSKANRRAAAAAFGFQQSIEHLSSL
jgi:hypothetical protein